MGLSLRRVGLLGGSFNPAHSGHRALSQVALRRLDLSEVWWLVSPQNPLKSHREMAPFAEREASARAQVRGDRRMKVVNFERRWGTTATVDALARLPGRGCDFVWLMGADNLLNFHRWKRAEEVVRKVPIVVVSRAPYNARALLSKTARRWQRWLVVNPRKLGCGRAPQLAFVVMPGRSESSSALRSGALRRSGGRRAAR